MPWSLARRPRLPAWVRVCMVGRCRMIFLFVWRMLVARFAGVRTLAVWRRGRRIRGRAGVRRRKSRTRRCGGCAIRCRRVAVYASIVCRRSRRMGISHGAFSPLDQKPRSPFRAMGTVTSKTAAWFSLRSITSAADTAATAAAGIARIRRGDALPRSQSPCIPCGACRAGHALLGTAHHGE